MIDHQIEATKQQTRVMAAAAMLPYCDEVNKTRLLKVLGDAVGDAVYIV